MPELHLPRWVVQMVGTSPLVAVLSFQPSSSNSPRSFSRPLLILDRPVVKIPFALRRCFKRKDRRKQKRDAPQEDEAWPSRTLDSDLCHSINNLLISSQSLSSPSHDQSTVPPLTISVTCYCPLFPSGFCFDKNIWRNAEAMSSCWSLFGDQTAKKTSLDISYVHTVQNP